jgi:hypothetical protein
MSNRRNYANCDRELFPLRRNINATFEKPYPLPWLSVMPTSFVNVTPIQSGAMTYQSAMNNKLGRQDVRIRTCLPEYVQAVSGGIAFPGPFGLVIHDEADH